MMIKRLKNYASNLLNDKKNLVDSKEFEYDLIDSKKIGKEEKEKKPKKHSFKKFRSKEEGRLFASESLNHINTKFFNKNKKKNEQLFLENPELNAFKKDNTQKIIENSAVNTDKENQNVEVQTDNENQNIENNEEQEVNPFTGAIVQKEGEQQTESEDVQDVQEEQTEEQSQETLPEQNEPEQTQEQIDQQQEVQATENQQAPQEDVKEEELEKNPFTGAIVPKEGEVDNDNSYGLNDNPPEDMERISPDGGEHKKNPIVLILLILLIIGPVAGAGFYIYKNKDQYFPPPRNIDNANESPVKNDALYLLSAANAYNAIFDSYYNNISSNKLPLSDTIDFKIMNDKLAAGFDTYQKDSDAAMKSLGKVTDKTTSVDASLKKFIPQSQDNYKSLSSYYKFFVINDQTSFFIKFIDSYKTSDEMKNFIDTKIVKASEGFDKNPNKDTSSLINYGTNLIKVLNDFTDNYVKIKEDKNNPSYKSTLDLVKSTYDTYSKEFGIYTSNSQKNINENFATEITLLNSFVEAYQKSVNDIKYETAPKLKDYQIGKITITPTTTQTPTPTITPSPTTSIIILTPTTTTSIPVQTTTPLITTSPNISITVSPTP